MVMTLLTRPKKTVATVIVATDGSGNYNCDGTADEVEINAAINSLPAEGGVVYMKEGTYNISDTVTISNDNVEIIGAGSSTIIQTTEDITMIYVNNLERVSVDKVHLIGAGAAAANNYGVYFDNVKNSYVNSCWVENCTSAIYFVDTEKCIVRESFVYDNFLVGIWMSNSANYNLIVNNHIYNDGNAGVMMGAFGANYQENCIVANNICSDSDVGIGIGGNTLKNKVDGNRCLDGIQVNLATSSDNSITNNTCIGTAIVDNGTNTQIFNNVEE